MKLQSFKKLAELYSCVYNDHHGTAVELAQEFLGSGATIHADWAIHATAQGEPDALDCLQAALTRLFRSMDSSEKKKAAKTPFPEVWALIELNKIIIDLEAKRSTQPTGRYGEYQGTVSKGLNRLIASLKKCRP